MNLHNKRRKNYNYKKLKSINTLISGNTNCYDQTITGLTKSVKGRQRGEVETTVIE